MELAPGVRCPVCGNLARSMRKPLLERFWEKVPWALPDDECWEWQGHCNRDGYGQIREGGRDSRRLRAHRVSWVFYHGRSIPDGMIVMHLCDTPSCVNPQHLQLGTPADNTRDMMQKGRHQSHCHEEGYAGLSPYTEEQVYEVLRLAGAGVAQRKIAAALGMSRRTVRDILSGKRWNWLTRIKAPEDSAPLMSAGLERAGAQPVPEAEGSIPSAADTSGCWRKGVNNE